MTAPVIVGVDGSERSEDAVVLAADLAEPGRELLLVHVHPYDGFGDLRSRHERAQLLRHASEQTARTVLATLEPSTSRSMRLVSNRSPAAGLHEVAATVGAPLIVVGSGHRARRGRVSSSSVAESVLADAPSPVAIASRGYGRTDRRLEAIGVGFDDSPESHDALRWAASLARRRHARLVVVAVHTPLAFGGLSTTGVGGYRSANEALREQLVQKTLQALSALAPDVAARHRLLHGDAAAQLARFSSELDLLVLGSRGYGALRTVLLGSVSRALVRTSRCPVVVVPRGAEISWSPEATYADWATLIA
jgi:nucleotide-binding universal stress UspA family protein